MPDTVNERHALPHPARLRRNTDLFWTTAAAAVVVWIYWWTATEGLGRFGSPGGNDSLLNQQVEAFHAGQLHLKIAPDPRLLALSNPYDPQFNRGTRLLDATLFKGAYYTYFGPVPLLCLMWPWYAVNGTHIPADLAAFIFGAGAFLLQAIFLLFCKRTLLREAPSYFLGFVVFVVGAGNLLQPMLRAHSTFDIPILSELFFASATILFVAVAVSANRRGLWAWCAASFSYGMAVGSRPNFIFAGIPLIAVFYLHQRSLKKGIGSSLHSRWLRAAAPGAICIVAFFVYNFARFGNPIEFGNRYTLIEVDWHNRDAFSSRYVLTNIYYYGFSLPRLSVYFPYFVESASLPFARPTGYLSYLDRIAGFVPAFPFALLGLGCCAKSWRRKIGHGDSLLIIFVGSSAVCVAVPLMFFIGPSLRYEAEIACPLFLLAGVFSLGSWPWVSKRIAVSLGTAVVLLGIWSALSNFLISAATYGYLREINPTLFRSISSIFNDVSYPLERVFLWKPKVPTLTLKFPVERVGTVEPLWVSGRVPEADFLYVYYTTPHDVQFGFEAMGRGGPLSDLIPLDYTKIHELRIVAGPFLPPVSHPFYREIGLNSGLPLQHLLRLIVDGRVVFDAIVNFHDSRGRSTWGVSEEDPSFGSHFTGNPFSVSWSPFARPIVEDIFDRRNYGDVELELDWPELESIRKEPLLSLGSKNSGQLVFVQYEGSGRIRIGILDQSGKTTYGDSFAPGALHSKVRISMPALYPGKDWAGVMRSDASPESNLVSIDSHDVFMGPAIPFPTLPDAVVAGRNALQASGISQQFGGTIRSTTRQLVGSGAND